MNPNDHDLLIRIETRLESVQSQMTNLVTREEFQPVQQLVYGMTGLILLAVMGTMVSMAIKKKKE